MKQILYIYELQRKLQTSESKSLLYGADVNTVRDIHPECEVVPSLLEFKNGSLTNVIKGVHQSRQFRTIFENVIFVSGNKAKDKPSKKAIVYTKSKGTCEAGCPV